MRITVEYMKGTEKVTGIYEPSPGDALRISDGVDDVKDLTSAHGIMLIGMLHEAGSKDEGRPIKDPEPTPPAPRSVDEVASDLVQEVIGNTVLDPEEGGDVFDVIREMLGHAVGQRMGEARTSSVSLSREYELSEAATAAAEDQMAAHVASRLRTKVETMFDAESIIELAAHHQYGC